MNSDSPSPDSDFEDFFRRSLQKHFPNSKPLAGCILCDPVGRYRFTSSNFNPEFCDEHREVLNGPRDELDLKCYLLFKGRPKIGPFSRIELDCIYQQYSAAKVPLKEAPKFGIGGAWVAFVNYEDELQPSITAKQSVPPEPECITRHIEWHGKMYVTWTRRTTKKRMGLFELRTCTEHLPAQYTKITYLERDLFLIEKDQRFGVYSAGLKRLLAPPNLIGVLHLSKTCWANESVGLYWLTLQNGASALLDAISRKIILPYEYSASSRTSYKYDQSDPFQLEIINTGLVEDRYLVIHKLNELPGLMDLESKEVVVQSGGAKDSRSLRLRCAEFKIFIAKAEVNEAMSALANRLNNKKGS